MQEFPPPRQRPLSPSPLVPLQQAPPGADGAPTATVPSGRHSLPAPRQDPGAVGRPGVPLLRARAAQPDAVVFTAPCPACGADCDWTEQREDTRLRAVVSCPCG